MLGHNEWLGRIQRVNRELTNQQIKRSRVQVVDCSVRVNMLSAFLTVHVGGIVESTVTLAAGLWLEWL